MWLCINLIRAHQAERLRAFSSASMFTKRFHGRRTASSFAVSWAVVISLRTLNFWSPLEVVARIISAPFGQGRQAGKGPPVLSRLPASRSLLKTTLKALSLAWHQTLFNVDGKHGEYRKMEQ